VRVHLSLSGLPRPDTVYLAHIHPGTCAEGEAHEENHEHAEQHDGEPGSAAAEEIEWPLSEVHSGARGHWSSTTVLKDLSIKKLYSRELEHLNVHAAGSGNPPVLACADLY
jgi:hypothetical protein